MEDFIPYPDEHENGPRDDGCEVCPACGAEVLEGEVDHDNDCCVECVPTIPYEFNFKPNEARVMGLNEMERALNICRVCQAGPLDKTKSPCFECRVINEKRS